MRPVIITLSADGMQWAKDNTYLIKNSLTLGEGPTFKQQWYSLMGEMGWAKYLGISFQEFENHVRSREYHDLVTPCYRALVDVKSSDHPSASCLYYPLMKTGLLKKRRVDALAFCTTYQAPTIELWCWITKQEFIENHHEAGIQHHKFHKGTWYLEEDECPRDPDTLIKWRP